jgi:hypothetical protein
MPRVRRCRRPLLKAVGRASPSSYRLLSAGPIGPRFPFTSTLVERRDLEELLDEATAADLAVAIELGLRSVSRPVAEAVGVAAILDAVFGTHGDSDRS